MNPTVLGLVFVTALIVFWCSWLLLGRVSIYEISAAARLEAERVHPVAATVGGRIVRSHLTLAREVRRGDVLLEIEAEREQLETNEEETRLAALGSQVAAIATEIVAEEQAIALTSRAGRSALAEASQRLTVAQVAARQADDQLRRVLQLREQGLLAETELVRARAEADGRRAEVAGARLAIDRLNAQQRASDRERRAHLGALVRERLTLEGHRAGALAAVTRRQREAEERRIRAPVDGRLGQIAPLHVGAVIQEGQHLASIVPAGQVRIIAEFLPSALGRVRAGQPARLRLDGFPWTQYGHLAATVQSVATETREGRVRVELVLQNSSPSAIPLEHGLPGAVEVEVERVTPFALLVRTLGYALVTAETPATPAAAPNRAKP